MVVGGGGGGGGGGAVTPTRPTYSEVENWKQLYRVFLRTQIQAADDAVQCSTT